MSKTTAEQMAAMLKTAGIAAEVTFCEVAFCRQQMVSILVADAAQLERVKVILARMPSVRFDSEDHDEECGHIAYYFF